MADSVLALALKGVALDIGSFTCIICDSFAIAEPMSETRLSLTDEISHLLLSVVYSPMADGKSNFGVTQANQSVDVLRRVQQQRQTILAHQALEEWRSAQVQQRPSSIHFS